MAVNVINIESSFLNSVLGTRQREKMDKSDSGFAPEPVVGGTIEWKCWNQLEELTKSSRICSGKEFQT